MKKLIITLFLIFTVAIPCMAATDKDLFDFFGPLPYGKMLDKTTIGLYSYQDMDGSGSKFFDTKMLAFGMPLGPSDIRVEGYFPDGSTNFVQIGTVVPLVFASLQASFATEMGQPGSPYQEVNLDLVFSNLILDWGIGIAQDIGSTPHTMPKLKVSKTIDTGIAKIEGRITYTQDDTTANETDIMVKARFSTLPIYAGLSNYSMSGGSGDGTILILGALFTL